jgi:hypothetical protein
MYVMDQDEWDYLAWNKAATAERFVQGRLGQDGITWHGIGQL